MQISITSGHMRSPAPPQRVLTPPLVDFPQADFRNVALHNRFVALDILGRGGMGIVYAGVDTHNHQPVVIKACTKLMSPSLYDEVEVIKRLAALRSVPRVFDLGVHEDATYMVAKFCSGVTLRTILKSMSAMTLIDRLRWFIQIAKPLLLVVDQIHSQDVIHRDLKSDNILVILDQQGRLTDPTKIRIIDFGISLIGAHRLSQVNLSGTQGYIAPEIEVAYNSLLNFGTIADSIMIDRRVDIYTLGVIFTEMISGNLLKNIDVEHELLKAVPVLRSVGRNLGVVLGEDINTIVLRMLHEDPAKRYDSLANVYCDLFGIRKPKIGNA